MEEQQLRCWGEGNISNDESDAANAPESSTLHQSFQSFKDTSSRLASFAEHEYRQIKKLIRSHIGIGGKHFILFAEFWNFLKSYCNRSLSHLSVKNCQGLTLTFAITIAVNVGFSPLLSLLKILAISSV